MYNFNFYMPTKVLFGPGKLNELHSEQLPGKKAISAFLPGSCSLCNSFSLPGPNNTLVGI